MRLDNGRPKMCCDHSMLELALLETCSGEFQNIRNPEQIFHTVIIVTSTVWLVRSHRYASRQQERAQQSLIIHQTSW